MSRLIHLGGGAALTNVTYMFLASLSNVFQMGAECAWKLRRGGMASLLHDASV